MHQTLAVDGSTHAAAAAEPAPLSGIAHSSCLKMLGVSIENNFSITHQSPRQASGDWERADTSRATPLLYIGTAHQNCRRSTSCVKLPTTNYCRAMRLSNHVLHALIPFQSTASQRYNLRNRTHSLQLPSQTTCFITRMLYKDKYFMHNAKSSQFLF